MRTITSTYVRMFFSACVRAGADRAKLADVLPGGTRYLMAPDHRYQAHVVLDVIGRAIELTGRDDITLLCGLALRPAALDEMGPAIVASATIREALHFTIDYQAFVQQLGVTRFEVSGRDAYIRWIPSIEEDDRLGWFIESVYVGYGVMARWLSWDPGMMAHELRFRHTNERHAHVLQEYFRCPIRFGQERNEMWFDAGLLDYGLPQASPDIVRRQREKLHTVIEAMHAPLTVRAEVVDCLEKLLGDGTLTIEVVAQKLGMSERTLRRRLAEEGTSFRDVLETLRRDLCLTYLRGGRWSIAEVAQMLGYNDQSAFSRAFKGWHGIAPGQFLSGDDGTIPPGA